LIEILAVAESILRCQRIVPYHLIVHRESKKGTALIMAITLSILDRFAKFFL